MDKEWCLKQAIEITKEYARSEGSKSVSFTLEDIYKKLKELDADSKK